MDPELIGLVDALLRTATRERRTGLLRLPPERELGAELNMSRGALREQLSCLAMLGFVNRTQGRGTYLQVPDASFMQVYFSLARRFGHLGPAQFEQARELLEMSVVAEAARRATDADVRSLRDQVDAMIEASGVGAVEEATEADFDFHRLLFGIVGNPMFDFLHEGFAHVMREDLTERRARTLRIEQRAGKPCFETDRVHYDIVDAIERRDPDAARAAMARHFELWRSLTESVKSAEAAESAEAAAS
ncbi:GntR family transcriptional regulator [Saccharopolyspora erythraea NRRL 2338]|uniref:Transcriptional regulator, GntR-family n=2 Tax=Saccharopolyspora erythraea TaxID=1836 RepID=A4FFC9_SACEN|nr:FCD domain-containing protein [Saccharopolyspora erythraea]PFG96475.1 GntR family transcriptional regulator [Saccharopolyspora erythraea NRRL 2338]QRK92969.1 FadR family transcriptional regulator [Saccharopolyspora erythraea]CAM02754.1 transcriptional regulator, GntR-family [Saccharopolyspora erythraea NRRL 2338]